MFDASLLKKRRLEKNLTQKDLGRMVGLSASAVGMYESSRRLPDVDTLCLIASALETPVESLFSGVRRPKADFSELVSALIDRVETDESLTLTGLPLTSETRRHISRSLRVMMQRLALPERAASLSENRAAGGR